MSDWEKVGKNFQVGKNFKTGFYEWMVGECEGWSGPSCGEKPATLSEKGKNVLLLPATPLLFLYREGRLENENEKKFLSPKIEKNFLSPKTDDFIHIMTKLAGFPEIPLLSLF